MFSSNFFKKLTDNKRPDSLVARFRQNRFALFTSLIADIPRPLRILDVGGTQVFWELMGFTDQEDIQIVLLNLTPVPVQYENFTSLVGDATDLSLFEDQTFDIVFSNSVIEHVGGFDQQQQMAREVLRVGKRYFVQTPNRYFPIEPHFMFPLFQFFPFPLQLFILRKLGGYRKIPDKQEATAAIRSIQLLTKQDMVYFFPNATLFKEKLFGLTKSFVVYDGWDKEL